MTNFQSLNFYLFVFMFSCIFANIAQHIKNDNYYCCKSKKNHINYDIFMILSMMLPITVASSRYNVGIDFNNYVNGYYRIISGENAGNGEFAFRYLNILSKYIFSDSQGIFLFSSIITICFLYAAIQDHDDKISFSLALFLYYTKFYALSLNVMRQSIAMTIVFYSYKYIVHKDFKKFLIFVILATSFHTTALIVLPFYFLGKKKKKESRLLIKLIIASGCIFAVFGVDIILVQMEKITILSRYANYVDMVNENAISFSALAIQIIIMFCLILFRKKLLEKDRRIDLYSWLYICGFILTLTSNKIQFAGRIAMYFNILSVILIPYILSIIKNKVLRNLGYCTIITYGFVVFIVGNYINNGHYIIPFNVFWH